MGYETTPLNFLNLNSSAESNNEEHFWKQSKNKSDKVAGRRPKG